MSANYDDFLDALRDMVRETVRDVLREENERRLGLEGWFSDGDHRPGMYTIVEWFATHDPEAFMMLADPVRATIQHGQIMKDYCLRHGYAMQHVDAPPCMKDHGIVTINAYSAEALKERLGESLN